MKLKLYSNYVFQYVYNEDSKKMKAEILIIFQIRKERENLPYKSLFAMTDCTHGIRKFTNKSQSHCNVPK